MGHCTASRRWLAATALLGAMFASTARAEEGGADEGFVTPIGISFFSPLQILSSKKNTTAGLDVTLVFGVSRNVYGVAVGVVHATEDTLVGLDAQALVAFTQRLYGIGIGGLLHIGSRVYGLQFGALAAVAGTDRDGRCGAIQLSGLVTVCEQGGGIALTSLVNRVSGPSYTGLAVSLFNNAHHDFNGLQLGAINLDAADWVPPTLSYAGTYTRLVPGGSERVTEYHVDDAGSYTTNKGTLNGVSIAAILNRASIVHGVQLAGLYNSADDVTGAQLGLINVSGRVTGFQLGLVNVTSVLRGLQLGVANIVLSGPIPFLPVVNVGW